MGDFYFYGVLLSTVIINIAAYNQHASKLDGTMASIMLQTKLASGRNVAILNTIHLSLRQRDGIYSSFRVSLLKWCTFQSRNQIFIAIGVLIFFELSKTLSSDIGPPINQLGVEYRFCHEIVMQATYSS